MATTPELELSCGEVLARLDRVVDGSLPDAERLAVERHVARCRDCERFGGRYAAIIGGLRAVQAPAAPDALRLRILAG